MPRAPEQCGKISAINRIKSLVLPPAWEHVWICPWPNGHLQATGIDAVGRKQYRYHATWSKARSEKKFHRLLNFGHRLPHNRHVTIQGQQALFTFRGKKGDMQKIALKEARLVRLLRKVMDIPEQELFQYEDESGHHPLDSGDVNEYDDYTGERVFLAFLQKSLRRSPQSA